MRDDFDADIAERYGWVNRTWNDGGLKTFVDTLPLLAFVRADERPGLVARKNDVPLNVAGSIDSAACHHISAHR